MPLIDQYKEHELYRFCRKEEDIVSCRFEVKKPDGSFIGMDVDTGIVMTRGIWRKWVDLNYPDRTNFRQPTPLSAIDIELAWHEKFQQTKKDDKVK